MNADNILTFLHLLAAFWYVMGLAAVQLPLVRGWHSGDLTVQAAFEEASHYQGVLLVPRAIAAGASGLFLWAQMGYNLLTTGWLLALERLYLAWACGRAKLAPPQARRVGCFSPDLEQALADNVPLVFGGLATLLVPVMTHLSVFKLF